MVDEAPVSGMGATEPDNSKVIIADETRLAANPLPRGWAKSKPEPNHDDAKAFADWLDLVE